MPSQGQKTLFSYKTQKTNVPDVTQDTARNEKQIKQWITWKYFIPIFGLVVIWLGLVPYMSN